MTLMGNVIDEREKNLDYGASVSQCWRLLAYDDAFEHLTREVNIYRLPDVRVGPKTEAAIWHALERFSIPQVRRQITTVVKDAAALSQRRDFVQRHAMNTIPGSLIRNVDRAISENWQIWPVVNNWQNEESVLLTVLFNRVLGTGVPGFKTMSNSVLESTIMKGSRHSE
jgi:hypothetical protein